MRVQRVTTFVRCEIAPWWRRQREVGVRLATAERLRDLLALVPEEHDDPTSTRLAGIEARLAAAETELATHPSSFGDLQRAVAVLTEQAAHARRWQDRWEALTTTTEWVRHAVVPDTLVTVVLATRNRAHVLRRAVESVLAQTHPHWELLIVDDASTDATPDVIASFDDPRIRGLRGEGQGVCAARNLALRAARGELVAYVDDDNHMAADWLKAAVWAFDRFPDHDVLYGAQVMESRDLGGEQNDDLPWLHFETYDRRVLEHDNISDLGAMVHRAGHPEAAFDEELSTCSDWDLLLRLTRQRPPLQLPVIAGTYTTSGADRLSADREGSFADRDRVRSKARQARPLRVLAYNWMYPQLSETYIEEDLRGLVKAGAEVACHSRDRAPVGVPAMFPLYRDLDAAVAELTPDVLLVHWALFAEQELANLERIGIPFAVRPHSFGGEADRLARLREHPLFVGSWDYPYAAAASGSLALSTNLDPSRLPEPSPARDLVVTVTAGLRKRQWDLLWEAFVALGADGVDCRVVVGITEGHEYIASELLEATARLAHPPLVQLNLQRGEVLSLLARSAALVYTLQPEERSFGSPMSIAEALCLGASVIVPDRAEAIAAAGPNARTFRTAADVVAHARASLAGGPDVERERAENIDFGRSQYCDPDTGKRFLVELTDALETWRRR